MAPLRSPLRSAHQAVALVKTHQHGAGSQALAAAHGTKSLLLRSLASHLSQMRLPKAISLLAMTPVWHKPPPLSSLIQQASLASAPPLLGQISPSTPIMVARIRCSLLSRPQLRVRPPRSLASTIQDSSPWGIVLVPAMRTSSSPATQTRGVSDTTLLTNLSTSHLQRISRA